MTSLNNNLATIFPMKAVVQSTLCSVVKRATEVARNGIVVTANMMTDCHCSVGIDIVRNANSAPLLIG